LLTRVSGAGLLLLLGLPDIQIRASQRASLPGGDGIVPGYARTGAGLQPRGGHHAAL
jgi:hypothetical protein